MKRIITLTVLLILSLASYAQPYAAPGPKQSIGAPGVPVLAKGGMYIDSLLRLPKRDTGTIHRDSVNILVVHSNNVLYFKNSAKVWKTIDLDGVGSGGSGGGITQLGNSGNLWMIRVNDSTYAFDTASGNSFYRSLFVQTGGAYANPTWLSSLAWSKITGTPTTLSGYGITDGVTSTRLLDSLAAHTTRFNGVTASLATKLAIADTVNKWVTAIRRSNDSIFYQKGGTWTFAYKDSLASGGGGGSFTTDSLRFNSNSSTLTLYQTGATDLAAYINSSYLLFDSTYSAIGGLKNDSTARQKSIRLQFNGSTLTPVITDSTLSWNILVDTSSISSFSAKVRSLFSGVSPVVYSNGAISLDTSAGKWRSENYYNTKYALIGASGGVPSGNFGNGVVIRNGAFAVPGSDSLDFDAGLNVKGQLSATNFLWAGNSLYPYLALSGNDPIIYYGGTGAAYPSSGRSSGVLVLNGSNTAKRVNINSYAGGPNFVSFYDNGTSRSATFLKTSIYVDTIIGGASDGSIMGNAYIGDTTSTGTGNSGHMFRAIARQGYNAASLNTFYSTVKMGNNNAAATQGHSVSFQHDAFKYGPNTQDISYGAAFLADMVYGGTVNKRYGLAQWDANVNTGGGARLGIQATIKVEKLKAAVGFNGHILADSSDYGQLNGNMFLGDTTRTGSLKAFHFSNGTAPSSSISGAIIWAQSGELMARDGSGNVMSLTDPAGTSYNDEALASITAGAGFVSDTVVFTDTTIYGSFYTAQDSFYITNAIIVMKGQDGDSLGVQIAYNDTINVGGTIINGGTLAVNNRTTGNEFSISTNQGIPPNSWVWVKSPTVIAGKKPEYLSITLIGYKKYIAP